MPKLSNCPITREIEPKTFNETENHPEMIEPMDEILAESTSHHCENQETSPSVMQQIKINNVGTESSAWEENFSPLKIKINLGKNKFAKASTTALKCSFDGCKYQFKSKRKNSNWKSHLFFRHYKTRYVSKTTIPI